jgi:AcrR family transcriptional regulator
MINKKTQKYLQIIKTAQELFLRFGINRVSIEEICRKSSVSKVTFYKHFSNKTSLIKYILNKMFSENLETFKNLMESDLLFPQKVEKTIHLKIEWNKTFSEEFFQDLLVNPDPEINQLIQEKRKETLNLLLRFYGEAQKRGEVRQDIKLEFILYLLNKMYEMVKDDQLVRLYSDHTELTGELTNFFFYGLLSRKEIQ